MRRTAMVLAAVVVLGTAGVSSAQTTTTSTTTSTSSTTTTTVLVPPMPTATLSGAAGTVAGELSSNCWPMPNGGTACGIVDYTGPGPNPPTLAVTQGESLTLRFDPPLGVGTLTATVSKAGPGSSPPATLNVPASDPAAFPATMAPGTYLIGVTATFSAVPGGRVLYFFQVRVPAPVTAARPAQAGPATRISLTG